MGRFHNTRWEAEEGAYRALWQQNYGLPPHHSIPNWKTLLAEHEQKRETAVLQHRQTKKRRKWGGVLLGTAVLLAGVYWWWRRETAD